MQAVAVFNGDCEVLGLWLRAQTRSSSCLAAGYNRDGVVKFVGGTVHAVLCLKVTARYLGSGYGFQTRSSSCLAAGVCNRNGVVRAAPAIDQWMRVTSIHETGHL